MDSFGALMRALVASAAMMGVTAGGAFAGTVTGGSLLSGASADQLETWIGVGDQDFTAIWTGTTGASATSFHAAADGAGPTVSIYDMTLNGSGDRVLVGGYTTADWAGFLPKFDAAAFIFNLTTGEVQEQVNGHDYGYYSIYTHPIIFPTFGGGNDLYGGAHFLGAGDGMMLSYTYDNTEGLIGYAGDSGDPWGNSGFTVKDHMVHALEVYTFTDSALAAVPLPASGLLLVAALGGIGAVRRKRG